MNTLIYNIGCLVTNKGIVDKDGIGIEKKDLGVIEDAEIFFENGIVRFAGPKGFFAGIMPVVFGDAKGGVVMPALVDPHTHAVFAGSRHNEFEMRAEGKTYLDIAKSGGGIIRSTQFTYNATTDQLAKDCKKRIETLNRFGVGAVEIKSGYGLTTDMEIKILKAVKKVSENSKTEIIPTFMGAHAVPKNYKNEKEKYVDLVINEMIPKVAEKKLATFCDVFAEEGFFSIEESRKILLAAKDHGMKLKIHADEFASLGGAQLAAELGVTSADHLLAVDEEGIKALAASDVTAVCLPGTSLFLGGERFAPARKMIDAGVRVALATDLNPGSSYTENMLLILTLACTCLKMTVSEAIAGATYNAAKAVGLEGAHGALFPGRVASVALFDVPHYSSIPYHMGVSDLAGLWIGGKQVMGNPGQDAKKLKEKIDNGQREAKEAKKAGEKEKSLKEKHNS